MRLIGQIITPSGAMWLTEFILQDVKLDDSAFEKRGISEKGRKTPQWAMYPTITSSSIKSFQFARISDHCELYLTELMSSDIDLNYENWERVIRYAEIKRDLILHFRSGGKEIPLEEFADFVISRTGSVEWDAHTEMWEKMCRRLHESLIVQYELS